MTGPERGSGPRPPRTAKPPALTAGPGSSSGAVSAGAPPGSSARARAPRRAAGIYGTIITAAILAALGDHVHTIPLTVSILVTLVVYWLAEEYAELLGDQLEGGRLPTWGTVRAALGATWPMVTASYLPLLALILAHLLGASVPAAANAALAVAIVLLTIYAWSAGRAARLHGRQLLIITAAAAALGLLMIVLKDVVLIHLH